MVGQICRAAAATIIGTQRGRKRRTIPPDRRTTLLKKICRKHLTPICLGLIYLCFVGQTWPANVELEAQPTVKLEASAQPSGLTVGWASSSTSATCRFWFGRHRIGAPAKTLPTRRHAQTPIRFLRPLTPFRLIQLGPECAVDRLNGRCPCHEVAIGSSPGLQPWVLRSTRDRSERLADSPARG